MVIGTYKRSEETRRRRSQAHKGKHNHNGKLNPMFGKHHSLYAIELMSDSAKGNSYAKGASRPDLSEYNRTHIRRGIDNPNYGNRILAGILKSLEHRVKISQAAKKYLSTSEGRKELRQRVKKSWDDMLPTKRDERIHNWMLSQKIKPNKPERLVEALLDSQYPNEWKYVGDGQIIIAGKNPDFININGEKLIIEVWANYWYEGQDPQGRIDFFKQYGFETLVIWESELKDPDTVLEKLGAFVSSRKKT